jgi:NAD(P)-dependent dehydrogenase (short-subunit alcohol dehydrogenase family)
MCESMAILDQFRLDDRTAIVTGGNRGIGRAIAQAFAEAGANVVVANRTASEGEEAAADIEASTDSSAIAVETDVSEEADVEALVDATVEEFGGVDVLVNNAGVAYHNGAEEKPIEEWHKTLDINLTGAFLCSKYAGQEMIDGDDGSIINISSMSAFIANYPQRHVDYQASKAGLEGFRHQLASEWAQYGVRVNNIAPGYIQTEILIDDEELLTAWKDEMLMDELGQPEDIASAAVFLASDASSYMTGETIVIDGGYTVR